MTPLHLACQKGVTRWLELSDLVSVPRGSVLKSFSNSKDSNSKDSNSKESCSKIDHSSVEGLKLLLAPVIRDR